MHWLTVMVRTVAFAGLLVSLQIHVQADSSRPNILFIAVDDMKPALGAYGDPYAITPNMDKLAGAGQAFEKAYCQYAVCAPSRASLLTGLRPDTTEVLDLTTHIRDVIPEVVTLPQHFGQQGYHVAGIGKLFHGGNAHAQDNELSFFGNWQYTQGSKKSYYEPGKSEYEDAKIAAGIPPWKVRPSLTDRGVIEPFETADGNATRQAMQLIQELSAKRKADGTPFFLAVGYKKPHLPFTAPEQYWELYDGVDFGYADYRGTRQIPEGSEPWTPPGVTTELSHYGDFPQGGIKDPAFAQQLVHAYYACVSFIDDMIGELVGELEAQGQLDDTIIIIWGDHGWHLGDHDGFWAKHSNFEQATRSPLIISYPDLPHQGLLNANVVEFVDIYPTLCELAGVPLPEQPAGLELQGASLVPIMNDPSAAWPNTAFSQYRANPRNHGQLMGHSIRDPRYRLTAWYKRGDSKDDSTQTDEIVLLELYDYQLDPGETRNVAADPGYQPVVKELMAKLDAGRGWMNR